MRPQALEGQHLVDPGLHRLAAASSTATIIDHGVDGPGVDAAIDVAHEPSSRSRGNMDSGNWRSVSPSWAWHAG